MIDFSGLINNGGLNCVCRSVDEAMRFCNEAFSSLKISNTCAWREEIVNILLFRDVFRTNDHVVMILSEDEDESGSLTLGYEPDLDWLQERAPYCSYPFVSFSECELECMDFGELTATESPIDVLFGGDETDV